MRPETQFFLSDDQKTLILEFIPDAKVEGLVNASAYRSMRDIAYKRSKERQTEERMAVITEKGICPGCKVEDRRDNTVYTVKSVDRKGGVRLAGQKGSRNAIFLTVVEE